MSAIPQSLSDLKFYLAAQLGVKGDRFSIRGYCGPRRTNGFHLGDYDIFSECGEGDADYSIQHPRNRAGLTKYSAGFDIGIGKVKRLPLTMYLVRKGRNKWRHPDTGKSVLFEVIGLAPDGNVYRWGNDNDWVPFPNSGHTDHTHVGFFRDTEFLSKIPLFEPFFE